MDHLIWGNLFSLAAMGTDALSASRKTARGVLLVQSLSQIFYGLSSVVLKGYSAAAQNAVSLLRNALAIRGNQSKLWQWLLIALGVGLGVGFNNLGLVGWLPIVANLEYSLAVFRYGDNERALKIAFLINSVLFGVFNAAIYNVVGVAANIVVVVTTVIFLMKEKKGNG